MKATREDIQYLAPTGYAGFKRIGDASQHTGPFLFLVAQNGNVSFDESGTEVKHGDIPASTDTFVEGREILGPFEKVQLTSGVAYAYYATFPEEEPALTSGDKEYNSDFPESNER